MTKLLAVACVVSLCFCTALPGAEPKPRLTIKDDDISVVSKLAFSPDGKFLAVFSIKKLTVWDTATGKRTAMFETKSFVPDQVAFSPDGRSVWTIGSDTTGLHHFDLTGKLISAYKPKDGFVDGIAFGEKGQALAAVRYS